MNPAKRQKCNHIQDSAKRTTKWRPIGRSWIHDSISGKFLLYVVSTTPSASAATNVVNEIQALLTTYSLDEYLAMGYAQQEPPEGVARSSRGALLRINLLLWDMSSNKNTEIKELIDMSHKRQIMRRVVRYLFIDYWTARMNNIQFRADQLIQEQVEVHSFFFSLFSHVLAIYVSLCVLARTEKR